MSKFNNKDPKYKSIRNTNIALLIVFFLLEIIVQDAQGISSPNGAPVIITFFISRFILRKVFLKNPDFQYKILKTIGVWIGVVFLKGILGQLLLSMI